MDAVNDGVSCQNKGRREAPKPIFTREFPERRIKRSDKIGKAFPPS
jgi:hypothetical protein